MSDIILYDKEEFMTGMTSSNGQMDHAEQVTIPLKAIKLNGGTQPRDTINNDLVADYSEAMIRLDQFPPVLLYYDGTDYWPADGFHRIKAALKAKLTTIQAIIRQGTKRDALLASFAANTDHGLRRSSSDKRRAVIRMLEDDEWTRYSDARIAEFCRCGKTTVGTIRAQLGLNGPLRETITKGKKSLINISGTQISNKKRVKVESPVLDKPPSEIVQRTLPSLMTAFQKTLKIRGILAKTHVKTDFGTIDLVTEDALYIVAGSMSPPVFRDAFVTLLFQRQHHDANKRAVIVGTTTNELRPWIREARRFGIEILEFQES